MKDRFWNSHYKNFDIEKPSRFANFCIDKYLKKNNLVVELGCGNGRDGFAIFNKTGKYIGIDSCPIAIEALTKRTDSFNNKVKNDIQLFCDDFTKLNFKKLGDTKEKLFIYSRFSYHSISDQQGEYLLSALNELSRPFVIMMEARTIYDELYGEGKCVGKNEYVTDHYRRFINPQSFISANINRFSFQYFEVARDFAPFKKENPIVMRAVFESKN